MKVLDLPFDILNLVVENLQVNDLLNLCASCHTLREAFRPDNFIWLMKHNDGERKVRDEMVRECSYIFRCHAFSELFSQNGLDYDYDALLHHGACSSPLFPMET